MTYTPKNFGSKKTESKKYIPKIDVTVEMLPSKSLVYPEGSEIKYRSYSYGEAKKTSQSKLNAKDVFRVILDGVETSFNKSLLTIQDTLFIGFLRKISTFGRSDIGVKISCGECGEENQFNVDVEKEIEFDDLKVEKFPITAELSTGELSFTPLTVKDLFQLIDKNKSDDDIAYLAIQCRNMNFDDAYSCIYNCNVEDTEILTQVDNYLFHGVKPISKFCKECKHKIEIKLDIGGTDQQLVLPFRERKESVSSRIRFG